MIMATEDHANSGYDINPIQAGKVIIRSIVKTTQLMINQKDKKNNYIAKSHLRT